MSHKTLQRNQTLSFDGFSDWFIKFNDPLTSWERQPTYLLAQLSFVLGAIITFIHAIKNGGRLPYLWIATLFHGLFVEAVAYNLPDIDNFWHSQTPLMLLGRRLPLHIIGLYPVFIYNATIAVSRLRIRKWAEPFAVGLMVVLIDIPYDITSVKFVHWTWHDTDPNIFDRHYWVPWNSYYFHACFAASFTFWFNSWCRWLGVESKDSRKTSCVGGTLSACLTGVLAMPGGVLLFLPLYHPLHDLAGVHSEVTFMMLFSVFLLIIWTGDRLPKPVAPRQDDEMKWKVPVIAHLIVHYSVFLGMVVFGNPENERSIGVHEPLGPCDATASVVTAFGSVLKKRKYLCISDYDEAYFALCDPAVGSLPAGSDWYTICGTPFENRAEYIAVIGVICFIATVVFSNVYCSESRKATHKKWD